MLTDAGPLVAVIDQGEMDHAICMKTIEKLKEPLITTWPALTEATYLLGRRGGWVAQNRIWQWIERDALLLIDLSDWARSRCKSLMEKYQDLPMDLADASLVAVAEERKLTTIFTLDTHFSVYRLHGRTPFKLIPEINS